MIPRTHFGFKCYTQKFVDVTSFRKYSDQIKELEQVLNDGLLTVRVRFGTQIRDTQLRRMIRPLQLQDLVVLESNATVTNSEFVAQIFKCRNDPNYKIECRDACKKRSTSNTSEADKKLSLSETMCQAMAEALQRKERSSMKDQDKMKKQLEAMEKKLAVTEQEKKAAELEKSALTSQMKNIVDQIEILANAISVMDWQTVYSALNDSLKTVHILTGKSKQELKAIDNIEAKMGELEAMMDLAAFHIREIGSAERAHLLSMKRKFDDLFMETSGSFKLARV
jgi:predicted  nucleic acid-binding Zn-ribbon protein